MIVTHQRVGGSPPAHVLPRAQRNETWLVANSPAEPGAAIAWGLDASGEPQVYVPAMPYLVAADPVQALAFAFQVGLLAGLDLGRSRRDVLRLHVVYGDVEDAGDGAHCRIFLGLAALVS